MIKRIPVLWAGRILIFFFILLAVFHCLVLIGAIPSNIVWAGQIDDTTSNLLVLELTALFMTLLFLLLIILKLRLIKAGKSGWPVQLGIWIIFIYLVLNTIANLASGVSFENLIFAPLTLLLAILALRLALEKPDK